MLSSKIFIPASGYWGANCGQQASNSIATGHPYGSKYDANWEIIALSEGWANYREWKMAKVNLSWNSFSNVNWSIAPYDPTYYIYWGFPYTYASMFYKLNNLGCSDRNLEKSLSNNSIQSFKESILSNYPSYKDAINLIMKDYE